MGVGLAALFDVHVGEEGVLLHDLRVDVQHFRTGSCFLELHPVSAHSGRPEAFLVLDHLAVLHVCGQLLHLGLELATSMFKLTTGLHGVLHERSHEGAALELHTAGEVKHADSQVFHDKLEVAQVDGLLDVRPEAGYELGSLRNRPLRGDERLCVRAEVRLLHTHLADRRPIYSRAALQGTSKVTSTM